MNERPKIKYLINNEMGAFICVWLPIICAITAAGSFAYYESNRNNYSFFEILYLTPALLISLSLILWPIILLWWRTISSTFKNGIKLNAINTNKNIEHTYDLNITYKFEYNGKTIEHIASLVPNKRNKELAKMQSFEIAFNPNKNLSFIKNVYI